MKKTVGIIGGGLSGLISAHFLSKSGFIVTIFEKENIGGRISSMSNENSSFDVGAQYFTVRNKNFSNYLKEFNEKGIIKEWKSNNFSFEKEKQFLKKEESIQRFVGVPSQISIINQIESNLNNATIIKREIKKIQFHNDKWKVYSNDIEPMKENFDFLILAGLAPEIIKQLSIDCYQKFEEKLSNVEFSSCECLMVSFKTSLNIKLQSCFINDSEVVSWISNESSKPGRQSDVENWTVHSTKNFKSTNTLDDLYNEFIRILKIYDENIVFETVFKQTYSWKYAAVPKSINDGYLFDDVKKLGICGDYCSGSRVEGAFISAFELSKFLINPFQNNKK
eukprot:gene4348-7704_t